MIELDAIKRGSSEPTHPAFSPCVLAYDIICFKADCFNLGAWALLIGTWRIGFEGFGGLEL